MFFTKDFIIHVAKSQLKPYPLNMIPFGDFFFFMLAKQLQLHYYIVIIIITYII